MAEPLATIERTDGPDGVRLRIFGEIDLSNVELLHEQMLDAFDHDDAIWIDLSVVTYVDSQGLRLLKRVADAAAARGSELTVVAPSGSVAGDLMEVTQMGDYLRIVPE